MIAMEPVLLVRYAEIHLKGLNRPFFERALMNAIRRALSPAEVKVVREQGRIFVYGLAQEKLLDAANRLRRVFGIHSVSPTYSIEKDWSAIETAAIRLMEETLAEEEEGKHAEKNIGTDRGGFDDAFHAREDGYRIDDSDT